MVEIKSKSNSYANGNTKNKSWKWYASDVKRMGLLISTKDRVMRDIVLQNFEFKKSLDYIPRKEIIKFTKSNVDYSLDFSGKALTPTETLALGKGVCLEYANVVCTLYHVWKMIDVEKYPNAWRNLGEEKVHDSFYVIVAKAKVKNKGKDQYHAFVGVVNDESINFYEPQDEDLGHHDIAEEYTPLFGYNHIRFVRFDEWKECKECLSKIGINSHWK